MYAGISCNPLTATSLHRRICWKYWWRFLVNSQRNTLCRHVFLTLELVGGEWSASHLGCFTPSTHWMGPRTGLDDMEKILVPTGTWNSGLLVLQPIASHYIDCVLFCCDSVNQITLLLGMQSVKSIYIGDWHYHQHN
jgi:hypothetical protein